MIWEEGVPQDFKDAAIIHIYKKKGDKSLCDNHRGISLLCVTGKILARILLNRLIAHIADTIIPEAQCGFRAGRGTCDMVFAVRQVQEKCREQNRELHLVFVDLTKAFDTVNRVGLWKILGKFGCPPKIVSLIRSFHDNMQAHIQEDMETSEPFPVKNGVKQGCVLAPTLFSIVFSAMLHDAFSDCDRGIYIQHRADGGLFNLRRFQAKSTVSATLLREFLFVDDCALAAHSVDDMQHIMDRFASSCQRFGLTISLTKTESMAQAAPSIPRSDFNPVYIQETAIKPVDTFKYLGSKISCKLSLDAEITTRIASASVAFGRLSKRLWKDRGIKLQTKMATYRAVVIPTLLYCCETWTTYRRHLKQLEQFHQRCLRNILGIRWQDRVPNTVVLERSGLPSIEKQVIQAQLRWSGHIVRMSNARIPKMLLYGQLRDGHRDTGRPMKRFKDSVKENLKACNISLRDWETSALDRSSWRAMISSGTSFFEEKRVQLLEQKRERRKNRTQNPNAVVFACDTCGKSCASRIGLHSHKRTHQR